MIYSEIVHKVLFDYENLAEIEIISFVTPLPNKIKRWLGANHPDNRTRKIFYSITNIEIGEGSVINQNFIVSDDYLPLLKIGKRVAISPNVTVICASGPNNSVLTENEYAKQNLIIKKNTIIEDDVWIGANTVLLPGIKIGKGSIIGAGSVVTKDVPSQVIAAGNPAKQIRNI